MEDFGHMHLCIHVRIYFNVIMQKGIFKKENKNKYIGGEILTYISLILVDGVAQWMDVNY